MFSKPYCRVYVFNQDPGIRQFSYETIELLYSLQITDFANAMVCFYEVIFG